MERGFQPSHLRNMQLDSSTSSKTLSFPPKHKLPAINAIPTDLKPAEMFLYHPNYFE
jgi:hypothetical protein